MILRNRAKCLKCGEIIESKHRHDYVTCKCGNLAVDGGRDYLKRNFQDYSMVEELSCKPDCFLGEEKECPGFEDVCSTCLWKTENYEE